MHVFLRRFDARLKETGFSQEDEVCRVVAKALDAVHHLSVVLHYESCLHGVGLPPKDE